MLEPTQRSLLLDALRPPDGYQLDRAVGTTFSLDLQAMLTAPLAFAMFDAEMSETGIPDPIALLEATRRHASHMSIFCQAGQIAVPKTYQPIFSQIEDSVHGVNAPNPAGIFHPKVWVLRFTCPDDPPKFRLLVLSRNLTFDQSWDTVVRLDGERAPDALRRQAARQTNQPLVDFIRRLPGLAIDGLPTSERDAIQSLASQLRDVEFELPKGCRQIRFLPLGLNRRRPTPFKEGHQRALVISPFISTGLLAQVAATGSNHVLISRKESLDELPPAALEAFGQVFVLDSPLDPNEDAADEYELSGLHAKVFVLDKGWDASVLIGSSNATDAGFGRNVEFLVELSGSKKWLGVRSILEEDPTGSVTLNDLLIRYESPDQAPVPESASANLGRALDSLRHRIATVPITATIFPSDDGNRFSLQVTSQGPILAPDDGARLSCWPITLGAGHQHPLSVGQPLDAAFPTISFEALTSFIAFELELSQDGRTDRVRFVVNASLVGAPDDRPERILSSMLDNKAKVLRYLLFLLADPDSHFAAISEMLERGGHAGPSDGSPGHLEVPLLETILQTLAANPARLDPIARLAHDLRRTPKGRELLPAGFEEVWEPIWAARKAAQS